MDQEQEINNKKRMSEDELVKLDDDKRIKVEESVSNENIVETVQPIQSIQPVRTVQFVKSGQTVRYNNYPVGYHTPESQYKGIMENMVIKREIHYHIEKFDETKAIKGFTISDLKNFDKRDYLKELVIYSDPLPRSKDSHSKKVKIRERNNKIHRSEIHTIPVGCISRSHFLDFIRFGASVEIDQHTLPQNLKEIIFGKRNASTLNISDLPQSVVKVTFSRFTQLNEPLSFPVIGHFRNLTYLEIEKGTQQLIFHLDNFPSLQLLNIQDYNEELVCNSLLFPEVLKNIIFGYNFRRKIPTNMQHIESIKFSNKYRKPINWSNLNLSRLTSLTFGRQQGSFIKTPKCITNLKLPKSITSLKFFTKTPLFDTTNIKIDYQI